MRFGWSSRLKVMPSSDHSPSCITHLKDMITSWAGEEDKVNAKYDAIRGKSKQNTGGASNNNGNQGGHGNNYSGPVTPQVFN
jgi:hypothetical protein